MEGLPAPGGTGHVIIVGAPEGAIESLVIVLGTEKAVPLFDSTEEADEFLGSLSGLRDSWYPAEVPPGDLARLLEAQPEEVRYVALSPPPEDLEGGMEFRLLEIETLSTLLAMQAAREAPEPPPVPPRGGLLRRLFGW